MTISGIAWDSWVSGISFVYSTIIIVSICFFISFTLFIIRIIQVIKQNQNELVGLAEKLLQICHLLAMFFSSFYMFLYVWNYLHIYSDCNEMDCSLWFILIMVSITMTKVCIYSFLMLRSTLSFRNSFFEIPFKTSISITLLTSISQLTWMALMLSDFKSFLYSGSLCFRTLGPIGTLGIVGFNINDAISAIVACLIFYIKAKSVKIMLNSGKPKNKSKSNSEPSDFEITESELSDVFNKHIKLGMLIVIGSILIFLAGEFLTITMGLASCLHQCLNNIYIFLLFKENNSLYDIFCKCKNKKCFHTNQSNVNDLAYHLDKNNIKTTEIKVTSPAADQKIDNDHDNIMSEGICPKIDTCVIDCLSEMNDIPMASHVNTPSFLSKSLSSIPRFKILEKCKRDKMSLSSNNLKAPMPFGSQLKLVDCPTLTETPSVVDKKMNQYHINNETLSTPMFPITPTNNNKYKVHLHQLTATPANELNYSSLELPNINSKKDLSVVYD